MLMMIVYIILIGAGVAIYQSFNNDDEVWQFDKNKLSL